jgi:hypothetical protein
MFLKHKQTGELIEVLTMESLYNPCKREIVGQYHAGEELQDAETFLKTELIFTSGEPLPVCWLDSHYQEHPKKAMAMAV